MPTQGFEPSRHMAIAVYNAFAIFGTSLLVAIICTVILSTSLKRSPIWYLVMISGVMCGGANLFIVGQQFTPSPNRALCMLQAMLIYAAESTVPLAVVAFALHIYLTVTVFVQKSLSASQERVFHYLPYFVPIIPSFSILVASIMVGAYNPAIIEQDSTGMRCHIITSQIFHANVSISTLSTFTSVILNVLITLNLRRARRSFPAMGTASMYLYRLPTNNTIIRLFIFTSTTVLALLIAVIPWDVVDRSEEDSQRIYNFTAVSVPIILAILFGIQKDVLNVWRLCT